MDSTQVTVWVHKDTFSKEEVLVAPDVLGEENLPPHSLMEVVALRPPPRFRVAPKRHQTIPRNSNSASPHPDTKGNKDQIADPNARSNTPDLDGSDGSLEPDPRTLFHFVAKPMPPDLRASQPMLQVSITTSIANTFGYRTSTQARISFADKKACAASHVELVFRDQYLSRSDMWRMVRLELAGKTIYRGQKIVFLGTIKAVVHRIYVRGRTASSAYFCESTIPVFRSESARYVLFIQMSREMWDFDSEGTGEILFSRVIDEFLPQLFKKWVELEARHLVSIVLFSRLEYDHHGFTALKRLDSDQLDRNSIRNDENATHRDFYRVVVTDMASGKWTAILDELKKDFLVFLRDICLHQPREERLSKVYSDPQAEGERHTRICGKPTTALRGNILEAINIASSQFATDHIDRDLVRTGISIIIITPGTGIFEVDRQLLRMTSENLTNNGIGIDLVCFSNMPLHSVPLFKWLKKPAEINVEESVPRSSSRQSKTSVKSLKSSPSHSSLTHSAMGGKDSTKIHKSSWSFGIPQWIDVSYWTSSRRIRRGKQEESYRGDGSALSPMSSKTFFPRVRMYELQMMGVMELGLANISIPYLAEERERTSGNLYQPDPVMESTGSMPLGNSATSSRTAILSRLDSSHPAGNHAPGLLSVQARLQGDIYEWMATYDEQLFTLRSKKKAESSRIASAKPLTATESSRQVSRLHSANQQRMADEGFGRNEVENQTSSKGVSPADSEVTAFKTRSPKVANGSGDSRISRAISFALRGLGPTTPRAIASTEVKMENVQAEHTTASFAKFRSAEESTRSPGSPGHDGSIRSSTLSDLSYPTEAMITTSRPISIRATNKQGQQLNKRPEKMADTVERVRNTQISRRWEATMEDDNRLSPFADENMRETEGLQGMRIPEADPSISPWIKNVNPANPTKDHPENINWMGRWHHIYPQSPRTSTVKWKSLCTPASVPLTTEEFPSVKQWRHEYTATTYVVSPKVDGEGSDTSTARERLLREMIGLRLSHGYQIVVGRRVSMAIGSEAALPGYFFMSEVLGKDGVQIYMSMGNLIQRLLCTNSNDVQVTRYAHNTLAAAEQKVHSIMYEPVIRTILSGSYSPRSMKLRELPGEYPWDLADFHLAGRTDDLTKSYEKLRFWRARFVVIPYEPPASARRPIQSISEDNEEEIHLLGIRELTRMWQKMRYRPPEELRFRPSTGGRKDPNPLEIMFQTLDPSEVVATEIEKLLTSDETADAKQIQLLPDSELLERSNTSLAKIAQVLQGERGVDIANRRWHLRMHHRCFKGDDFTNWLLSNFKDVDTREEAVEFGNELMQHGLFQHVSTRHTFKDGNYFYTIATEYRLARPESKTTWFPGSRRVDRSVPATPIAESSSNTSLPTSQTQFERNFTKPLESQTSERGSSEMRQVSVSLTKMIRIDLDHRDPKRSDRPEVVDLHYDRLHNPENCYHVELSWLSVTSKLVEDAIVTWATQLEKYGLRLVEVPVAEACMIADHEPFREPYKISLKAPPPCEGAPGSNGAGGCVNASFVPPTTPPSDKLAFHKRILKEFDFVLDMEAASEFPPDVDIAYTWRKLDYHHSQYVHRSGVVLAQVTDTGEILLLSNRLYNSRSASAKDATGKVEAKSGSSHWPVSGLGAFGLGTQHQSPYSSPLFRATDDGVGSKDPQHASGAASLVTPEYIRDELERFCNDEELLQLLYKDVAERAALTCKKTGSTSSSALRPMLEHGLDTSIPDLRLPASVVTTSPAALKSLGVGLRKKSSTQQAGRTQPSPENISSGFSRRGSVDLY